MRVLEHGRRLIPSIRRNRIGAVYVRKKWGQIEIPPPTQAQDRTAEAQPGTDCGLGAASESAWNIRCKTESANRVNIPVVPLPLSIPVPLKRKRVLLVDDSQAKRDMRAEAMRKLGMDVDCAADIGEARSWWRADLYNLVLIHTENDMGNRDRFCEDVRSATPPQQLAFLVGKPDYLADVPAANGSLAIPELSESELGAQVSAVAGVTQQRWGILEACQRISAVRSASDARTRAMRNRPAPPRDPEGPRSKRAAAASQTLNELLQREEIL
jgi:CheY-like chemotaxis protein